ncbi:hypothetical protein [Leptolyngbya sp. CCY15150]|uniref:hypothetical protein n=1 Tax=Leptolyngbya sp. CCY15150 TaxID=2767772 RepID=UPI00194EDE91|nr:hypothetical protein [Leptolyngbya sp. CCY15150]
MNKILSKIQHLSPIVAATIFLGILLLFNFPSLAQVHPNIIPRIETIEGSENLPPAYRLIISQPQDNVYVFCPSNFEPELTYLRNVETLQCKPFTTP